MEPLRFSAYPPPPELITIYDNIHGSMFRVSMSRVPTGSPGEFVDARDNVAALATVCRYCAPVYLHVVNESVTGI